MRAKIRHYPTRVPTSLAGTHGSVILDRIRTVDKTRLIREIGQLDSTTIAHVKRSVQEMLVD